MLVPCGSMTGLFHDFKIGQVRIGFGQFAQLCLDVEIVVGQSEGAGVCFDIGFDLRNAVDRFQIASDRGGTTASRHVGDIEFDQASGCGDIRGRCSGSVCIRRRR
jgi:hypothetical protein